MRLEQDDPEAGDHHQHRHQSRREANGGLQMVSPERQQQEQRHGERRQRPDQAEQAAGEPGERHEDDLAAQAGAGELARRHRHVRRHAGGAAALPPGLQLRAVRQQGLGGEARLIAHAHIQAEGGVPADEATAADVDTADEQIAAFDPGAGELGVGADAGIVTDRDQIPGRDQSRIERAAASDLGAHQPVIDRHQRGAEEQAGAGQNLQPARQPPADVIAAPRADRRLACSGR